MTNKVKKSDSVFLSKMNLFLDSYKEKQLIADILFKDTKDEKISAKIQAIPNVALPEMLDDAPAMNGWFDRWYQTWMNSPSISKDEQENNYENMLVLAKP